MIVLHAAPITWGRIGGLHVSIPALVAAQSRLEGVEAALAVTVGGPDVPPQLGFPVFHRKINVGEDGRLNLPTPFDRPDIVVFHSTYIPAHATIARRLRRAAIPYIICPRGGMTRYAQQHHGWKKMLGNRLFFKRMVGRAEAINCLTHGEAQESEGWNRPTFIVGNGTTLADEADLATPGRQTARRLIFIGRLHIEYKGLDMLLEACGLIRDELEAADVTVELHGPDHAGSTKLLEKQIAALQLDRTVELGGPAVGRDKVSLLRRADAFLHPSRSEGHPMAVLEALGHGLPCLLTPVTHVADEVAAARAGWRVEPTVESIARGIAAILATEDDQLQTAGENARRLAAETYAWDEIATRSVQEYHKWAA
ncbi:MAG: glycosyltransferase [Thermoguttaceae bacterium]